ncbi:MAG: flagellar hook-basal body complex protein FliE [Thermodesulfobacteriota bacterium]
MKIMAPSAGLMNPEGVKGLDKPPAPRQEFDDLLSQMVSGVKQLQQDSDQKVTGSLLGKEELHEAMLSLEKASLSLKLLVQVRNKMVEAYQELARMQM